MPHVFLYGEGAGEPDPDRLLAVQTAFSEYAALTDGLLREVVELLPGMLGGV